MCVLTCTRSFHVFRQSSSWGHRWWVSHIHVTLSQIDVWRNEKTHIMTWETHQSVTLIVFVSHRLIIGEMRRLTSWRERHINRTRSSLETGIWPLYPSWVWCVHYLEQNGYFWLVPEHAPGPSSQVLPGCRVRHPCYSKKLFVRSVILIIFFSFRLMIGEMRRLTSSMCERDSQHHLCPQDHDW